MRTIESGYERDRFAGRGQNVRWWFFVHLTGEDGRPQGPRQGVADAGFRFARGGRVETDDDARYALEEALRGAQAELDYWRGQASHVLGRNGELVPLDRLELPA